MLGRDILAWMEQVAAVDAGRLMWRFRNIPYTDRPYLLFGAATRHDDAVGQMFSSYVTLRHQQQIEVIPERAGAITVGVLLTPRLDGLRPWDTTMVSTRGDQGFEPKYREALEALWGPLRTTLLPDPAWDEINRLFREAGALA